MNYKITPLPKKIFYYLCQYFFGKVSILNNYRLERFHFRYKNIFFQRGRTSTELTHIYIETPDLYVYKSGYVYVSARGYFIMYKYII